jgi:retron-type reverse transcriptase
MKKTIEFITHTGEVVTGEVLQKALNKVANDWERIGRNIRKEDKYAPHVTEDKKEANLIRFIETAESIREGNVCSFTIWQRVNQAITGECVALLSK